MPIFRTCAARGTALRFVAIGMTAILYATNVLHAAEPARTAVFESGREGYHSYRIPSVIVTPNGSLLTICEGRKVDRKDHGDIDLVAKTSTDNGETWSPLRVIHEEGGAAKITIGNPCPVINAASGTIWLPFTRDNDRVFVMHSTDDGATWSQPREITADVKPAGWGWYATGPGVGIQLMAGLKKGRLLIPCDHREKIDGKDVMFSHVFYSDDAGKTWKLGASVEKHTDECQLAELAAGKLLINMRNYWGRDGKQPEKGSMRAIATSTDGGESWSPIAFDKTLIEPICQGSLLRLPAKNGDAGGLLFSNPASKTERKLLTVRLSRDEGKTWPVSRVLHSGPAAYSCLTILPDGTIGCLFEAGEKTAYDQLVFARFGIEWLAEKVAVNPAPPNSSPESISKVPTRPEEIPRIAPVDPNDALSTFRALNGFRMDLLAAEPLVNDPVDLAYDENGLAYVVEMRDYPLPEKADESPTEFPGRVRILEDTDGDGRFDKSNLFAGEFSWPTSVALWKGGAFIAAAPDIWYCKDTDGDRKADIRERVFTGFSRYNVQAIMNNLRWGLDHHIYGAASGNGGKIEQLLGNEAAGTVPKKNKDDKLSLSQRDFRFDPVTSRIEAISGGARFGNAFDDWGNRFVCNIRNPAQHVVLPSHYLDRNRFLPVPEVMHDVAQAGDQIPVYRISPVEPWRELRARRWVKERVNYPRSELVGAGFFTSSSGVTIYRGDAYPSEYRGNIFVADVAGNLIHRQVVSPDGVTFSSQRADAGEAEFVSSTDIWFRPVNFINAPDGTLHVLDMYRETIEHPWSIPDDIKAMLDLTSGNDRGRIYRLAPPSFQHRPAPKLGSATTGELVALLEHPNAWHRETASRLLFELQDKQAVEPLRSLLTASSSPLARLHALWALQGLGALTEQDLVRGLEDDAAGVREHAVRLAETKLEESELVRDKVLLLGDDPELRVRFQVAFSLGNLPPKEFRKRVVDTFVTIARRDAGDYWMRMALLSSSENFPGRLIAELLADGGESLRDPEGGAELLNRLAMSAGASGRLAEMEDVLKSIAQLAIDKTRLDLAFGTTAGLSDGLERKKFSLRTLMSAHSAASQPLTTIIKQIQSLLDEAARVALDASASSGTRVRAIDLLRQSSFVDANQTLGDLLSAEHPQGVQLAAVRTLTSFAEADVPKILLKQWKQLTPPVRSEVIEALLGRTIWIAPFLDAVESGLIEPTLVPTAQRGRLLRFSDASIQKRAEKIFGATAPAPRGAVIEKYQATLGLQGTPQKGKEVFRRECQQCHRVGREGLDVGPDLATIRHRSPEEILIHILDPNREVAPNFMSYVVLLKNGRTLTGNIATETAASITLKRAENATDTVLRADIEEISGTGKSIMPEGIEQKVDPAQMADLIAFLLRPE